MRLGVAALAAAVGAAGCGDRSPGAPAPIPSRAPAGLAAGAEVSVVTGGTGGVVAGASVVIGGRSYISDSAGRVVLSEAALPGSLVDVTAPGFFDRQTLVRTRQATRLALWPRTTSNGVDEPFTTSIVYTSAAAGGGPPGAFRLRRLPPDTSQVVIVPSAEILDDSAAHAFHAAAVARITAAARGAVAYSLSRERPAAGVIFDAVVRPSETLCATNVALAFVRLSLRGSEITGGEIVYCSLDIARTTTVVHEMGHTFGLQHSNDRREVMFGGPVRGRGDNFGQREADVMALLLERPAGNQFPDSDRHLGSSNLMDAVIVCR